MDLSVTVRYSCNSSRIPQYPWCNLNLDFPIFSRPTVRQQTAATAVTETIWSTRLGWPFTLRFKKKKKKGREKTGKTGFAVNCKHSRSLPDRTPSLARFTGYITFYSVRPVVTLPTVQHRHCWRVHVYLGRGKGAGVRVLGFCPTTCLLWLNLSLGGN